MDDVTLTVQSPVRRSESIAALAAALAKAQGEITGASKDKANPFFKSSYADLASVWGACRAPLSKNALAVLQLSFADGPRVTVTTMLVHSSGEFVEADLTMVAAQNTPQGIGSCITYARRYALSSLVGVAAEDDDAETATRQANGNGTTAQSEQQAPRAATGPTPAGFEEWWLDVQAAADEGWPKASVAFNAGKPDQRSYLTKHHNAAWEALKTRAAKASA